MDKKNQVDSALNMCINNLNEWVCAFCATQGSDKSSSIFRALRNKGYVFEETYTDRFDKKMYCPVCGKTQTHYKLLSARPVGEECDGVFSPKQTHRVLSAIGDVDAYTNWKATTRPMVDPKTPLLRSGQIVDPITMNTNEIGECYQVLSPEHISLKEKACRHCNRYGIRPPFMGKRYYYEGNDIYKGTCEGCGWYDGARWTAELNRLIDEYYRLKEVEEEYIQTTNTYKGFITYLTGRPTKDKEE